jgi:3-isopropylmalate dehydrogenase
MGDARVPDNAHARDILLGMRFQLDLFINLRPVQLFDAAMSPLRDVGPADVDLVIFRENTEGVYVGMGGNFKKGTPDEIAIEEDVNTRKGVERIIRAAFEYTRANRRGRVTLSDKANAMPHAGALWRRTFAEVAQEYGDVEKNACTRMRWPSIWCCTRALRRDRRAQSVRRHPQRPGGGAGGRARPRTLREPAPRPGRPVRAGARLGAGPGGYQPCEPAGGAIMTAALMLRQLGHAAAADAVERSVRRAVHGGHTTPDLGGQLGTDAVGDWVCRDLRVAGLPNT